MAVKANTKNTTPGKRVPVVLPDDEAKKRAAKIPDLKPGVVVKMPLHVLLAYMNLHSYSFKEWKGDLMVIKKQPIEESA